MSTTERPPATAEDWPIEEAAELIVRSGVASTAMLQRKLRLGHQKCRHLLDELALLEVVYLDGDVWEVLAGPDELDRVLEKVRQHAGHRHEVVDPDGPDVEVVDDTPVQRGGLGAAEVHLDPRSPGAQVVVRDETAVAERAAAELVEPDDGLDERPHLIGRIVGDSVHVITDLVTSDEAKRAGRRARVGFLFAVRQVWWPIAGAGVLIGRWRDSHTSARYERMIRGAEVVNDREALFVWDERNTRERDRRHKRLMEWLNNPLLPLRAAVMITAALLGLLLVIGIVAAITQRDISWVFAPVTGFFRVVGVVVWFLATFGPWLVEAAVVGVVVWLHVLGRTRTTAPAWVAPEDGDDREVIPDEGAILNALRNLGLPALDKRFKEGWTPRWVLGTGRDGKGWRTQLELPQQVTVEAINDKKKVLAHNLVRLPVEVWVTEPKRQPGVMDLWVADQGLLTGPVAAYPLLEDGTSDYFAGVPVGIDQRGSNVTGRLMAANYAIAGMMGSGKSTLVINLCAGAMLDPLVDIDIFCMAYNVDYDPMRPRLRTLVKGDEDEHVIAAMDALRALRHEVTIRGKALAELGGEETKVTRTLAERDPRLRPRLVVFDECQELFRHDEFGDEAKELAIKVMTKARKCAITLVFVTPEPSADSLPRELAKVTSHGVCFAITDHQGNDAILGTGSHKAGITAVSLTAEEDIGTAMARGFAPRPGLLRSYYIRKDKTTDELTPIVQRALALLNGRPVAALPSRDPDEAVDYLADILGVIGDRPRVHTVELLRSLAVLDSVTYGGWDTKRLKAETGLVGGKSNGDPVIRRGEVAALIAARGGEVGEPDED